jgi:hypothetical protein
MTTADYYELHKYCPQCRDDDYECTMVGGLFLKDRNKVWCRCGWTGIVDDLVAESK